MRIDSNIPPTTPFHLARAYNARPVEPVSNRMTTTAVDPIARIGQQQQPSVLQEPQLRRLVAGVVPGGINFDGAGSEANVEGSSAASQAVARVSAFPMYRHPSERNAAATGVHVGRALDVNA